jgi:hypothetical protein
MKSRGTMCFIALYNWCGFTSLPEKPLRVHHRVNARVFLREFNRTFSMSVCCCFGLIWAALAYQEEKSRVSKNVFTNWNSR